MERAELLTALAAVLPDDAIVFGNRCTDAQALAVEYDLVVVADGSNSVLRSAVTEPPRQRQTWMVWQASVTAEIPDLPAGACASVVRRGFFSGVFWLAGDRAYLVRRTAAGAGHRRATAQRADRGRGSRAPRGRASHP